MSIIAPELISKLHKPAPRYTSYPTAPTWSLLPEATYLAALSKLRDPLSLYIHIPFCHSMCLYCGCSVILNRRPENEQRYVDYLKKEIALVVRPFGKKMTVNQLHFGGGTPTKLTAPQLTDIMESLHAHFSLDEADEIAIEVDPRTVSEDQGAKLRHLKALGFNRISFGVQDTDEKVQAAVLRRQSLAMTQQTYHLARELDFDGINIDLIYGLPHQTVSTFQKTVADIIAMRPDRISLFSYAKVPWLKEHQKAIKDHLLPSVAEKFEIYCQARAAFIQAGYVAIGMDHFSLREDPISHAYRHKKLTRNFQGYTIGHAEHLIGLGVTSIGYVGNCYAQNVKDLLSYYGALDKKLLPIAKGKLLSEEDLLRKWVIQSLMCQFELDKREFETRYRKPFDSHFSGTEDHLDALQNDGLLDITPDKLSVTPLGELFVRNIAMVFDAYLQQEPRRFSSSI